MGCWKKGGNLARLKIQNQDVRSGQKKTYEVRRLKNKRHKNFYIETQLGKNHGERSQEDHKLGIQEKLRK